MEEVAERYAHALLEEAGDLTTRVEQELSAVHQALQTTPELDGALGHPEVDIESKLAMVARLWPNMAPQVNSLLRLLLTRKRLDLLPGIISAYRSLRLARDGKVEVVIESVLNLDDSIKKSIGKLARDMTGLEPMLSETINPNLLGGIRLRIGDMIIDGSLRKRLHEVVAVLRG